MKMLYKITRWSLAAPLLCSLVTLVQSFSKGAGPSACGTMEPRHFGVTNTRAPAEPPFTITVSQKEYSPGDTVKVVIRHKSTYFKGFFVQARLTDPKKNEDLYGTFLATPNDTKTMCDRTSNGQIHNAITQTAPRKGGARQRNVQTLVWTAPKNFIGDIKFHVTVVEWYRKTWVGYTSDVITGLEAPKVGQDGQTTTALARTSTMKATTVAVTSRTEVATTEGVAVETTRTSLAGRDGDGSAAPSGVNLHHYWTILASVLVIVAHQKWATIM